MTRPMWVAAGVFAAILFTAGVLHLALRSTSQLYFNIRDTDEKQTQHIFALEKRVDDMERKVAVFEANLRYEKRDQQEKSK